MKYQPLRSANRSIFGLEGPKGLNGALMLTLTGILGSKQKGKQVEIT